MNLFTITFVRNWNVFTMPIEKKQLNSEGNTLGFVICFTLLKDNQTPHSQMGIALFVINATDAIDLSNTGMFNKL